MMSNKTFILLIYILYCMALNWWYFSIKTDDGTALDDIANSIKYRWSRCNSFGKFIIVIFVFSIIPYVFLAAILEWLLEFLMVSFGMFQRDE